jgi:Domain of unknown function (DUF1707)
MRTSTADRERAVDVLTAAFAEGRLDQDEYTERMASAYESRTYGQLAALTADLPVGPLGAIVPGPELAAPGPCPSALRRRRPVDAAAAGSAVLAGFGVLGGVLAGSSNVLGALGPFGIVAFILAIVGYVQIARRDAERGLLLASFGLVIGSCSLIALVGSS